MSEKKPLIALPTDYFYHHKYHWYGAVQQYIRFILDVVDAIPILIPNLGDENLLDSVLENVDGVMATGAVSNVHPSLYQQDESEAHAPFDPERDSLSLPMIRKAIEKKVPLLCICRGMQELNVALGGSLEANIQDLPGRIDHRSPETSDQDRNYAIHQDVNVCPHSLLSHILQEEKIKVNSLHYQGIKKLASPLEINALAEDSTIEAISLKQANSFVLGLQWHPEYWAQTDEPSQKIAQAFRQAIYEHYNNRHS